MKRTLVAIALALVVAIATAYWALLPPTPPSSQVFVNGTILTMDSENRTVEAIAIEGDRIVAVGSRAEIEGRTGDGSVIHDLRGQTLLPGFIDAHGHFPGSGLRVRALDLTSPPVGRIESLADLLAALRARAAATPPGDWILGFGYDDTLLAEKRHPSRRDLDSVSTEHPIYLWHISGHMGVANGPALERGGIDASTPDPEGGVIARDPETGAPSETER